MRRLSTLIALFAIAAAPPSWLPRGAKPHETRAPASQGRPAETAVPAAAPGAVAPAMPIPVAMPAPRPYRIGGGDRLKINVYNADKLTGEYNVGGDGKIAFPMLGRLKVAGLTLDELTAMLTQMLGNGYLLRPAVSLEVISFRPVYILGEVEKPGQYAYSEKMTVYMLVAQAGGFTYRANRKTIKLRHEGDPEEGKYRVVSSTAVQPGDTIYILQRFF